VWNGVQEAIRDLGKEPSNNNKTFFNYVLTIRKHMIQHYFNPQPIIKQSESQFWVVLRP